MSDDAKRLIDSLFDRIKTAEKNTGERDREAEGLINKHLVENPCAPYYMAQTIIMQEAALKQLNARVEELERAAVAKSSSGGFLSGLFGGSQEATQGASSNNNANQNTGNRRSGWGRGNAAQYNSQQDSSQSGQGYAQQANNTQGQAAPSRFGRGGSFLGGALQTAAGVAGGVVVGNMLMNMFGHHSQTEIVDVINEPPMDQGLGANNMGQNDMGQSDMGQSDFANSDASSDGFNQGSFEPASYEQGGMDQGYFDQGGFSDMGGFGDFGGDDFF